MLSSHTLQFRICIALYIYIYISTEQRCPHGSLLLTTIYGDQRECVRVSISAAAHELRSWIVRMQQRWLLAPRRRRSCSFFSLSLFLLYSFSLYSSTTFAPQRNKCSSVTKVPSELPDFQRMSHGPIHNKSQALSQFSKQIVLLVRFVFFLCFCFVLRINKHDVRRYSERGRQREGLLRRDDERSLNFARLPQVFIVRHEHQHFHLLPGERKRKKETCLMSRILYIRWGTAFVSRRRSQRRAADNSIVKLRPKCAVIQ